jgi:hypothetical protein
MKQGCMTIDDTITLEKIVKAIISDFKNNGTLNFGEWLTLYQETMPEVEGFVRDYCDKVNANNLDAIERWQKVVMLNSIALYMIEMDIDQIPYEMMNKILAVYIETILNYNSMLKGNLKLIGQIFISDITLFKFIPVNENRKNEEGNPHR